MLGEFVVRLTLLAILLKGRGGKNANAPSARPPLCGLWIPRYDHGNETLDSKRPLEKLRR